MIKPEVKVLVKMRTARGLTLREMGEQLKCHQSMIGLFESGRRPISELWARRLGEFFDCDWRIFWSKKDG